MATRSSARKYSSVEEKKSFIKETWFIILATLLAVVLLLYPVAATQWNNYRQQQVSDAYSQNVDQLDGSGNNPDASSIVQAAKEYNTRNAAGPIIDPWSSRVSKDNKVYQEYLHELNTLEEMSQVIIPSINVNLPLYHGTEDDTLQKGLGHLFGTALPVGGKNTHSVITGHTGMPDATMFDNLSKLKTGDVFYVNTYGKKMKYQVYDIEVVLPEETDSLWPIKEKDLITLITCTPYGVNSHRLLVHAERVPMDEQEEQEIDKKVSFLSFQWWMILFIGIALVAIFLLTIWLANTGRKIRNHNNRVDRITARRIHK